MAKDQKARGQQTRRADFDRNRDGLYGGLPKVRDRSAAGAKPHAPHPPRDRGMGPRSGSRTRG